MNLSRLTFSLASAALAAALLCLPAQAAAVDRAVIEKLPEISRVESRGGTTLVLRGELSAARRLAVANRARAVVKDVDSRFLADGKPRRPVDVCLFETVAGYRAFASRITDDVPSELGFYEPGPRVVVVNLEAGLRNMSHEIVHPLIDDDFPGIPPWLAEGTASLYGGSDPTPRGIRFFVNYRHRDVSAAMARGALPSLADLAAARAAQVYGDQAMIWYAFAREVLLLLESKGQLSGLYQALRAGAEASIALSGRVDDAEVLRFARRVKEGQVIEPPH